MLIKTKSVALVCKLTIPTERPPLVGEFSAHFSGYFNVTSGGIRYSTGTPTIKKVKPLPFYQRRNNERRGKNKNLDIEQIYGHGSQRGSMPGVTVLAGCRQ
jgi:hypothetical protein